MFRKIYILLLLLSTALVVLASCHGKNDVQSDTPTTEDQPVIVDTTFADTAIVEPVETIVILDTTKPVLVVEEVIRYPSLQEIYSTYIGVREATGRNDGPEVERFLRNVGLGKGYPWCAAFVKTCLLEAGYESAGKMNGMALSTVNKSNMVYSAGKKLKEPQPGDVATLWYNNLGRIGHTLFFDNEVNSNVYESVEGNTNGAGSREGDGVYRKKRSYKATYNISRWE